MFKLSIELMQIWPRNKWRKCYSLELDKSLDRFLTQGIFIENCEIILFRSNYMHILMYLCRVSFFTTLDIYKDYFKDRHKMMHKIIHAESALVHYSLWRSSCVFMPRVLWPRSFLIFIVDELKNFSTNNLLQVGELVMYWNPCIII